MPNGLGRGLGSLIPQKIKKIDALPEEGISVVDVTSEDDRGKVLEVDPGRIEVNPMQPRSQFSDFNMDELVESIKEYGIIQPLIVTRAGDKYELIAGERRLRAAKQVGLTKVPVIVRDASSQRKLEMALVENLQREDLNPIEAALAYKKLADEFNLTQEEVAKRVGKSRSAISNCLRFLNLPEEIQQALVEGKISEGHAKYLMGLDGQAKQLALFKKILRHNLTVRDTDSEAKKMGGTKQARVKIDYADKDREFSLREFFGTKVEIKRKGKGGLVVVSFFSDEELENIMNKVK
ncbi:MAG: ParB/RepB/Spo0J family partition protein [Patescibacteria group bacterium]|nr:ParB/RepB/Spo0J family partition protein [Patescibacteria group bacterium]MDD5554182.1 ParB/RepB/Spo0J family partition protein [Patescibacteria group bacterium]